MQSYKNHLKAELADPQFKEAFEEEKYLLEVGLKISRARRKLGLTQKELALRSHITQQQLSKIENGINCNLLTFVKISSALGFPLNLEPGMKAS
jgi:DNA-binding XRE family transcriptional regulator